MGVWVSLWVCRFMTKDNVATTDAVTSKSSTFPYDDETMHSMIRLVQKAKGTPMFCKENDH
jgi:hypothetical protein